jgi:choline-glycine betaine transporter
MAVREVILVCSCPKNEAYYLDAMTEADAALLQYRRLFWGLIALAIAGVLLCFGVYGPLSWLWLFVAIPAILVGGCCALSRWADDSDIVHANVRRAYAAHRRFTMGL